MRPIKFDYHLSVLTLENNGYFLNIKHGPGSHIIVQSVRFALKEVNIHTPSEHRIGGMPFDVEFQLNHIGENGQRVNVSILANEGSYNKNLSKIWSSIPRSEANSRQVVGFSFKSLLPKNKGYFRYPGSETSPPCSEGIDWIVLASPIEVSSRQIDEYEAIFGKNARGLQSVGARTPLRSR